MERSRARISTSAQKCGITSTSLKRVCIHRQSSCSPRRCADTILVEWSLNDSLKKLRLDYVDLFLMHWPVAVERTADYMPKIGPDGKVC